MSDYDTDHYHAQEIQHVLDTGPDDVGIFRMQVRGTDASKWINVTRDQIEAIRDILTDAAPTTDVALVLTIDHRQGFEVSVHRSHESATADLVAWVDQFWAQDGPEGEMPDDAKDAVKAYFDFADESYHIVPTAIPAP